MEHLLYERDDPNAPACIKDANGDITLGLCRVCGKGEAELAEPRGHLWVVAAHRREAELYAQDRRIPRSRLRYVDRGDTLRGMRGLTLHFIDGWERLRDAALIYDVASALGATIKKVPRP